MSWHNQDAITILSANTPAMPMSASAVTHKSGGFFMPGENRHDAVRQARHRCSSTASASEGPGGSRSTTKSVQLNCSKSFAFRHHQYFSSNGLAFKETSSVAIINPYLNLSALIFYYISGSIREGLLHKRLFHPQDLSLAPSR